MRSDLPAIPLALAVALAACSDASYVPPIVNQPRDAGVANDAQTNADGSTSADGGPTLTGLCNPKAVWIKPRAVGFAGKEGFGAITADETTVAWMEAGSVHWADRKTAGDVWGPQATLTVTAASARIALAASGLRIVFVVDGGKTFGEISRATKTDAFAGAPDTAMFDSIKFALAEAPADAKVDDPVLARDDLHLLFTFSRTNAPSTMRLGSRADDATKWSFGQPFGQAELVPVGTKYRRPTGISADRLTLFYWDEVDAQARAAFRLDETSDFATFIALGQKPAAQVNGACTQIYYDAGNQFEYASRQ
ncbi:hypothetical protein BH09MYX1_BH09MYX1_50020 [soil metagenome]